MNKILTSIAVNRFSDGSERWDSKLLYTFSETKNSFSASENREKLVTTSGWDMFSVYHKMQKKTKEFRGIDRSSSERNLFWTEHDKWGERGICGNDNIIDKVNSVSLTFKHHDGLYSCEDLKVHVHVYCVILTYELEKKSFVKVTDNLRNDRVSEPSVSGAQQILRQKSSFKKCFHEKKFTRINRKRV